MIAAAEIRLMFDYDPEDGLLVRKSRRGRSDAGSVAGTGTKKGYLSVEIDHKGYLAHRLAWLHFYGEFPESAIDHKDRNKQNNRIGNLRLATDSENKQNRVEPQANNQTGLLGVCFHKAAGKWMAQIKLNRIRTYLGLFDSPELAHAAYLDAKRLKHGFAAA